MEVKTKSRRRLLLSNREVMNMCKLSKRAHVNEILKELRLAQKSGWINTKDLAKKFVEFHRKDYRPEEYKAYFCKPDYIDAAEIVKIIKTQKGIETKPISKQKFLHELAQYNYIIIGEWHEMPTIHENLYRIIENLSQKYEILYYTELIDAGATYDNFVELCKKLVGDTKKLFQKIENVLKRIKSKITREKKLLQLVIVYNFIRRYAVLHQIAKKFNNMLRRQHINVFGINPLFKKEAKDIDAEIKRRHSGIFRNFLKQHGVAGCQKNQKIIIHIGCKHAHYFKKHLQMNFPKAKITVIYMRNTDFDIVYKNPRKWQDYIVSGTLGELRIISDFNLIARD